MKNIIFQIDMNIELKMREAERGIIRRIKINTASE